MAKQVKNTKGQDRWAFSVEELQEADQNCEGCCIACGEIGQSAEPDARGYTCDSCGEKKVYGAGELAIMGYSY